ncbi:MAG: ABC transporter permease [Burkholderiales bacterium]|nr:MAG: ABC transporter permease [Burkholderiales bacterium]
MNGGGVGHLDAAAPVRARGRGRSLGIALLVAVTAFALLGPSMLGIDPTRQALEDSLLAPGMAHPLGTDVLGRSVLARLAHAARLSLGLALASALTAAVPGVLLGVLAAWRGGVIDRTLSMLADATLSVPGLLLVLLFAAIAPGRIGALYAGLALVLWVEWFRVARAASRPVLAGHAVQASRLLGFGRTYLLRHHVLPELAPLLRTMLALGTAQGVLALAALGFIGVGVQPPTAELGLMMTEYLPHWHEAPWLIAAPTALLMAVVLGMMLVSPADAA